jgi:hypothetical protein
MLSPGSSHNPLPPERRKPVTYQIFGAYALLPGLLAVAIPLPIHLTAVSVVGAALAALGCIFWSTLRLGSPRDMASFQAFQTSMLVSLAFAQLVSLLGLFLGSKPIGPWPFVAVTWALMFGLILPKMNRYWRSQG